MMGQRTFYQVEAITGDCIWLQINLETRYIQLFKKLYFEIFIQGVGLGQEQESYSPAKPNK